MEEDELKEIQEVLASMVEEYKQISFDSDESEEEEEDKYVDDDY